ncbi:MAG: GNAT family N-acetyltransferase [Tissierellia bacterium]|jgi:ribosomal protein S18 acetylase RimI-like enzyme|nr:GNAT family N-acetyltransferase [Tissierellia bacterium]
MTIRSIKAHDIPMIASVIAGRNQMPQERCGYIDTDVEAITRYLNEIYQDGGSIVMSRDGIVAGDVIDDNRSVEVIGPYGDSVIAVRELIEELRYRHPSYDLLFYVDKENRHVIQAVTEMGATSEEHWEMIGDLIGGEPDPDIRLYRRGEYVYSLHDEIFPRAYYAGRSLEEMSLSGQGKLALFKQGGEILGYIFYQTDPAYIDFLGVDPAARQKGIGSRLLAHACQDAWHDGARQIQMSVRKINPAGVKFLEKHGFTIAEENLALRLRG